MILCIDIGNSQLHAGIYLNTEFIFQFRYDTTMIGSSDQFGLFLRQVCNENDIDYTKIERIGIASVVPSVDHTVASACIKYINQTPLFIRTGTRTGIKIPSHNMAEIGADLVAGAVGAISKFSGHDILIFDLGTATTAVYINAQNEFIGGAILPGIKLMIESLQSNTAKLYGIDMVYPRKPISLITKQAIQSGIMSAQVGAVKELRNDIVELFKLQENSIITIGTGGFANLVNNKKIFTHVIQELVLDGIKTIIELNSDFFRKY